jgi:hypothetical protein
MVQALSVELALLEQLGRHSETASSREQSVSNREQDRRLGLSASMTGTGKAMVRGASIGC